jgi:hypothetical protein
VIATPTKGRLAMTKEHNWVNHFFFSFNMATWGQVLKYKFPFLRE